MVTDAAQPSTIFLGILFLVLGAIMIWLALRQRKAEQENKAKEVNGGK
jgi:preprotein translocase subunit YajC